MSLSAAARKAQAIATSKAKTYGHTVIEPAHLLYGLLQDEDVQNLLRRLNADQDRLNTALDAYLSGGKKTRTPTSRRPSPKELSQEVVQIMDGARQTNKATEIAPLHLLVCILVYGKNTFATKLLKEAGVTQKDIKLAATVTRTGGKNLKAFCTNLNQLVVQKKIGPVFARDEEMETILRTLSRKNKCNPILVGDSGVGKTAVAKGLAYNIVHQNVPDKMKATQVFLLNQTALAAGAVIQGELEKRLKGVVIELEADKNAVLFIDDIHTLSTEMLGILKPALEAGTIRCIGATNYKNYRTSIESDQSLARLFLKQDIAEPKADEALKIVMRSLKQYEDYHSVRFHKDAVATAVKLATRYIPHKKMPDKVFDIIDQAGAQKSLYSTADRKSIRRISVADIERTVAEMTNLPTSTLSQNEQEKMDALESGLRNAVMDQDEAIKTLMSAVRRAHAGLNDPKKPIGNFLFQGPTGVGKTEIVQQLGSMLGRKVHRFDMSEYMEKHSVARLIGSPPGYVGHDQGGLLTEAATQSPHSIILLDEIEKAHPDIYNILLQVMDHGTLTDSNGKKVDFRNTMIIMTTNAGSSSMNKPMGGFAGHISNDNGQSTINEAIKKLFTPEFRNRLDAIVPFKHLERPTVLKIADKFLGELGNRLADRNIRIAWTEETKNWLVDKGFNRDFGARPMARMIQNEISNPLADHILSGKLKNGGKVTISFNKAAQGEETPSGLVFDHEDAPALPKKASPKARLG